MVRGKLLLASSFFLAPSIFNSSDWGAAAQEKDKIDQIFAGLTNVEAPGIALLVKKDGRAVAERHYGVRDLREQKLIDSQTNFRLASCTKQLTAMAIMILVREGKLRYEERLTEIFPEFPAYGKRITIRNLLNHTSGLPDYEDLMDQASSGKSPLWTETRQIGDAEVLKLLETQSSGKFLPGTQWSYSNSGYVVLGLVAAKVSGKPFEDLLDELIFKPLTMSHTLAYVLGKNDISDRAYGHTSVENKFDETDQSATSATLGDGGVYSNLEDLAKWDDALERHTLLAARDMRPALVPVRLADGSQPHWASGSGDTDPQAGKPVSYGFGWFLDAHQNHARMWHYGDTTGFKTAVERFTGDHLTVILLANRSDLDVGALAVKVADLYLAGGNISVGK
jgi:CubicO group peptidase (beta-lactamase class C family)